MTTLKEYKETIQEMMKSSNLLKNPKDRVSEHVNFSCESLIFTPDLIRVIELAEVAINAVKSGDDNCMKKCNIALSEIRKLKGD